jgi:hypothetical protein
VADDPVVPKWSDVAFDCGLTEADYPVFYLARDKRFYIGKFVTRSRNEQGQTEVVGHDSTGRPFAIIKFPRGHMAYAVFISQANELIGICADEKGQWRLVKLSLSGRVIWNKPFFNEQMRNFKLSFGLDDWPLVKIIEGPTAKELSLVWHAPLSKPEFGMISFSPDNGAITRVGEGIRDASGNVYLIEGGEIVQSDRTGQRKGTFTIKDNSLSPFIEQDMLFPIRNNGEYIYGLNREKQIIRFSPIKKRIPKSE